MIAALARPGRTVLHRTGAAAKLAALAVIATGLFFVDAPAPLAVAFGLGVVAARSTGVGFVAIGRDLAGPAAVLAVLGLVDWLLVDGATALAVVLRLGAIALFAHAVTVTTSTSELTEVLERLFAPLQRLGLLDAGRAALTVTLAIRFVPLVVEEAREIRDAQAARGLDRSIVALAVPLLVRVLVRAQDLADAIDARGFPPDRVASATEQPIRERPTAS